MREVDDSEGEGDSDLWVKGSHVEVDVGLVVALLDPPDPPRASNPTQGVVVVVSSYQAD